MISLNGVFLIACAWLIIYANVNAPALKVWLKETIINVAGEENKGLAQYGDLAPTLVLSFANGIVVPVSKLVSKFEKWDYKHR